ncbi:MAG TPA: SCO family protein [Bacteroidia bacterium]|nr:SCO family protein [Bacteroidia bacterium]
MTLSKSFSKFLIALGILLVPSISYLIIKSGKNNYSRLDIFGPKEPSATNPKDTLYHKVADFNLISQDGKEFSGKQLQGKIYVVDFFFATCQTICPKMTMQMKRVQEAYKSDPEILLISHTVNPEKDTVESLARYAAEYGAEAGKWYFLTGDKKTIYDLARNSYFITAMQGDGGADDFIHSEKLVLIDKDRRIRGFYDGTDYESVNLLIDEIKVLKWEYNHK